jgi:ribosomal 50S subunit-associated protein YjgA (DUF615 family)
VLYHQRACEKKEPIVLSQKPRTAGRRAGDKERAFMRRLELSARNFIAHTDDHPDERLYPFTRTHAQEVREIFKELDALRSRTAADGTNSAAQERAVLETHPEADPKRTP